MMIALPIYSIVSCPLVNPLPQQQCTYVLQSLGWNKIAVINNQHLNFVDSKHSFLRNAKEQGVQIATHLETFHFPKEYLRELQRFGIKIVVAIGLLCTQVIIIVSWHQSQHLYDECMM